MNNATHPFDVRHDPDSRRFVAVVDDAEAHLDYRLGGEAIRIVHTEVPPAIGGRGVAGALMRSALAHARAEGLKVVPECEYAIAYLERHPTDADGTAAQPA